VTSLEAGLDALANGNWDEAITALEPVAGSSEPAQAATALEALADAYWWQGDANAAIHARERAYNTRRNDGDQAAAARAAAWLAREYAAALGNVGAARGWLARAETLAATNADPTTLGWVALTRATLADDAADQAAQARTAVDIARTTADGDLEVLALARLGLAQVTNGELDEGLGHLDEAMAAASAGDARGVTTVAQLCCDFVLASELAGETDRFGRWSEVVDRIAAGRGQPSPAACCTTCSAEASVAHGDIAGAEKQLHVAVVELAESGRRSRCIPPGTKLAEILLLQGRLEEADRALAGADDDASLVIQARVALARGAPSVAATLAERARRRLGGDGLLAVPPLSVLVDAHLAAGDVERARAGAQQLADVAAGGRSRKASALAAMAGGRVALADGRDDDAVIAFEDALHHLRGTPTLDAAHARYELAKLYAAAQPELARTEARAAIAGFEAAGAAQLADATAALLRSLGDHGRVGAKDAAVGALSRREDEVLRLVAQGLTNAEIAERLFISVKTAGNHVSAILSKLGLRSRTEAAAYVATSPKREAE
jgi:DNA-binding CsgD family transcriptional regulator